MQIDNFITDNAPCRLYLKAYEPYNRINNDNTKYYIITDIEGNDLAGEYFNYNNALNTVAFLSLENANDFKNTVLKRINKLYNLALFNPSLNHRLEHLKTCLDLCNNTLRHVLNQNTQIL